MGRKPKAARVEATSNVTGNSDPSPEMMENEQHIENPGSVPAKKKAAKSMNVFVRRSGRLRNISSHIPNKEMVVEEIDLVDSEGQDEPHVEELSNDPKEPHIEELSTEPISSQQDLEEKIDFLVQSVKEFKSKATKRTFPSETQFTELNYKSLYIDSQKKIDSLVDENHQLAKKLEFALGKVEAYEQMKDVVGNLKDMMLLSNLGKATEAVINFSSQTGAAKCNLPAVGSPAAVNDDNLPAVGSPPAANDDEAKASPEKKKRARKKSKC